MPYFVYRVSADKKTLTPVETFDGFKPARDLCRSLRKDQSPEDTDTIRMTFANSRKEAEGLLRAVHKPSSPLEEWEG